MEVERGSPEQSFLFRGGNGFGCTGQAAVAPVTHFKKYQGIFVKTDEVDLTAAAEYISIQNVDATAHKIACSYTFCMIAGCFSGFSGAIHGLYLSLLFLWEYFRNFLYFCPGGFLQCWQSLWRSVAEPGPHLFPVNAALRGHGQISGLAFNGCAFNLS